MDKCLRWIRLAGLFLICTSLISCASMRCPNSCTDEDMTTTVLVRINADYCLYYQDIHVTTYNRVITLQGYVENQAQYNETANLARTVPGVRYVKNLLHIKGDPAKDW